MFGQDQILYMGSWERLKEHFIVTWPIATAQFLTYVIGSFAVYVFIVAFYLVFCSEQISKKPTKIDCKSSFWNRKIFVLKRMNNLFNIFYQSVNFEVFRWKLLWFIIISILMFDQCEKIKRSCLFCTTILLLSHLRVSWA